PARKSRHGRTRPDAPPAPSHPSSPGRRSNPRIVSTASMRPRLHLLLALALVSACGKKIGDACQPPSDCAPDGNRLCELNSPDGYCTIRGCDFGTCPSEAVCVRFYPGLDNAPPCAT